MTQDKLHAMKNVVKFIHNYPNDWITQVFGTDYLAQHLQGKWEGYGRQYKSGSEAMLRMIAELDAENERKLMEYIDEQKFAHGGIIANTTNFLNKKITANDFKI